MRWAVLAAALAAALGACVQRGVAPLVGHFNKGVYFHAAGDVDGAVREFRAALEDDPEDRQAHFNLAAALDARAAAAPEEHRAAALAEAEAEYQAVLERWPAESRAAINLAALERERGDREGAAQRLDAALAAAPRDVRLRVAAASHALADARSASADAERAANLARAESHLAEALREDGGDAAANALLADCKLLAGAGAAARAPLLKALERAPDDVRLLLAAGRLELAEGRFDSAAAYMHQALYVDPEAFEAHLLLARAARGTGDLEQATRSLWAARARDGARPRGLARPDYAAELLELYRELAARESG